MKIKYSLIEKLIGLTQAEMDLLLYAARYQDTTGEVEGLYYGAAMQATGMCKQSFYNALAGLARKGIIRIREHTRTDYNVTILHNSFENGDYRNYVNLNRKIFRAKAFRDLKANEKWLFLEFLKNTHGAAGSVAMRVKTLYDKYTGMLGVKRKVVTGYLHSLKKFFSIGIKNGKYYINYKKSVCEPKWEVSENRQYLMQRVSVIYRRNRIKEPTDADLEDGADLLQQFKDRAAIAGCRIYDLFEAAVQKCGVHLSLPYINNLIQRAIEAI